MDLVYVLGTGSKWQNNEIRYSLRSVHKYFTGFNKVVIIGHKPSFLTNVLHIKCPDAHPGSTVFKERNICHKILRACAEGQISDRFLFMNDDYFFMRPVDVKSFPVYHKGKLEDSFGDKKRDNPYRHSLRNTYNILKALDCPTLHYDSHVPIIYHKKKFIWAMGNVNWDVEYGYTIKSLYANQCGLGGEYLEDCKLGKKLTIEKIMEKIDGRFIFSIGDPAINDDLKLLLQNFYPTPSPYEIKR